MPNERTLPNLSSLPRTVFARSESLPADSATRAHSHPWGQLSFAAEGVLLVRTEAGSHVAPPQRAVWVPPGMPHTVATSRRAEMRSLYISDAQSVFCPPQCLVLSVTPLARELILAAAALPPDYDETGPDGRLVAVLLDQLAVLPKAGFSLPWPSDPRLAAVCLTLADSPDDVRSARSWAAEAGMTERTLGRRFLADGADASACSPPFPCWKPAIASPLPALSAVMNPPRLSSPPFVRPLASRRGCSLGAADAAGAAFGSRDASPGHGVMAEQRSAPSFGILPFLPATTVGGAELAFLPRSPETMRKTSVGSGHRTGFQSHLPPKSGTGKIEPLARYEHRLPCCLSAALTASMRCASSRPGMPNTSDENVTTRVMSIGAKPRRTPCIPRQCADCCSP